VEKVAGLCLRITANKKRQYFDSFKGDDKERRLNRIVVEN
jgi:hypothetical protein